ncbi:hypothetical protein ABW20_dc0106298 [Dactylellina cionopaga]|nr:hypothetical protein ABW20_dc0106298 [Dactylellina cionopaga]
MSHQFVYYDWRQPENDTSADSSPSQAIRKRKSRFAATDPLPALKVGKSLISTPEQQKRAKHQRTDDVTTPGTSSSSSSSASSVFSPSVKRIAKEIADDECWLCGSNFAVDVCHVIPQADKEFEELRRRCILPPDFCIDGVENAIALCKRCHVALDTPVPMFVLVPLNLHFYLSFEQKDFAQRLQKPRLRGPADFGLGQQAIYSDSSISDDLKKVLKHESASRRQPGLLYQVYQRKDVVGTRFQTHPIGKVGEPKFWHGCPQVAIIHAFKAVTHPSLKDWLPDDLRTLYRDLADAWSLESSMKLFDGTSSAADSNSDNAPDDNLNEEHGEGDGHSNNRGQSDREESSAASSARSAAASQHINENQQSFTSFGSQKSETKKSATKLWQWGPSYTSNDAVELFTYAVYGPAGSQ